MRNATTKTRRREDSREGMQGLERKLGRDAQATEEGADAFSWLGHPARALISSLRLSSRLRVFVVAFSIDERELVRLEQRLGVFLPCVQPFRRLAGRGGELSHCVEVGDGRLTAGGDLDAGQLHADGPAEGVVVDRGAAVDDEIDRVALLDRYAAQVRVGLLFENGVARQLTLTLHHDAAAYAVARGGAVIELARDVDGAVARRRPPADDDEAIPGVAAVGVEHRPAELL